MAPKTWLSLIILAVSAPSWAAKPRLNWRTQLLQLETKSWVDENGSIQIKDGPPGTGILFVDAPEGLKPGDTLKITERLDSAPVLHGDRVYFGGGGSDLYALDRRTGAVVWKRHYEWDAATVIPLAASAGRVLFKMSRFIAMADAQDGRLLWRRPTTQSTSYLLHGARVFAFDDELREHDAATGEERWREKLGRQSHPVLAALDAERLLVADAAELRILDLKTRTFRALHAFPKDGSGRPSLRPEAVLVSGDSIYVSLAGSDMENGGPHQMIRLDRAGRPLWTSSYRALPKVLRLDGAMRAGGGKLYAWGLYGLRAFDQGSGRFLWSNDAPAAAVAGATPVMLDGAGLVGLDPKDGRPAWIEPAPSRRGELAADGSFVVFGTDSGDVYAFTLP